MRRLITGFDAQGASVFTHDGEPPEVSRGYGFELGALWAHEASVRVGVPQAETATGRTGTVPAPGAGIFTYVVIPPDAEAGESGFETSNASADFHVEDDGRMHRTDTIHYGVLLRGELWLELDHGEQRLLRAGDCFVQNGTRHAWHNRGSEPALMCVAMIGVPRA